MRRIRETSRNPAGSTKVMKVINIIKVIGIKVRTQSLIISAEDQVLNTIKKIILGILKRILLKFGLNVNTYLPCTDLLQPT